MKDFNKAKESATMFLEQVTAYEAKPTKAKSKRMRATLTELKQVATPAKNDLMAADKG
ncbi:MAG: hypothetical protein PF440_11480 [Thiomicrorhabdus sp.]|jgi:hypothetical protein|nr:hypothetical protein [Thiomicrorhabdus sp.]